jgi:hypothetical protein
MPTENPKISAYVPQAVYDRFKQFQQERGLSMSQAATELFSEYFGINLADNSTSQFTSGLLDRVERLEELVTDLKQSCVYLSEKVNFTESTSELLDTGLSNESIDLGSELPSGLSGDSFSELPDKLPDESSSELSSEPKSKLLKDESLVKEQSTLLGDSSLPIEPQSGTPELSSRQLEITGVESDEIGSFDSSLLSSPGIYIDHPTLMLRLGVPKNTLNNKKSASTPEQFTEWSAQKDSDNIGWQQSMKKGRYPYYSPATNLSDEQKANLQDWLKKSQNPVE